jgi:hypothetical protein
LSRSVLTNSNINDILYEDTVTTLGHGVANLNNEKNKTRLSNEFVKEMENYLESQYVPFYFHDLRTNEIISFHAFIDDVSESFAPQYNSSNPFGRVDPVMSYTNTTRTFQINFKLVATDEVDLRAMYVKLNKLTTLVYPQWTYGRAVQDSEGLKFRQPFSQMQGASPLVRIRLGDLIKTNFSNLALARLFGLGEKDILDVPDVNLRSNDEMIESYKKIKSESGWNVGENAMIKSPITTDFILEGIKEGGFSTGPLQVARGDIRKRVAEIYDYFANQREPEVIVERAPITPNPSAEDNYIVRPVSSKPSLLFSFSVNEKDLDIAPSAITKFLLSTTTNPQLISARQITNNFFDFEKGNNNAVVRSFKNTAGKGLAGFITSMNLDWSTATQGGKWETSKRGQKVPHLCGIQLQFTVIHDIAPGLDADGFNRAPLYNVAGANIYNDE